ncbi:acyl-CoA N-acyltransferase [Mycena galopus ATCC 62051]|nr:acyl-CoA N-acyltransferase [Mycena galopus ATCC 62051]
MLVPDILPSQSGRIVLVPPREEDDAALAALRSHPETLRHLRRAYRIAHAADETLITFHIHLTTGSKESTFGGVVALSHINTQFNSCEAGVLVNPEYFRVGLATDALYTILVYAFETRKFHRAGFVTAVGNVGMRGWLDKAGATLEGTKRDGWTDGNGGYTDLCFKPRLEERLNRVVVG